MADIHTLTQVIQYLKAQYKREQERYNLHPSDPYIEGKLIGIYEVLRRVEDMLQDEIDYRENPNARTA